MDVTIGLSVFVLGAIIGSFLNVCALRYGTGLSFMKGRSMCFSCGKTLSALELMPLLSFLLQRGKCAHCKSRISPQYFVVELITAFYFLTLFLVGYQPFGFVYHALVFCILEVIFVYDIRHKIIPDALSYTFAFLGFAKAFYLGWTALPFTFELGLDLLSGFIFFLPFFFLWIFSKGKWIGLGDGKLALGIGWYLGFVTAFSSFLLAFWIGAGVSLLLILVRKCGLFLGGKKLTMNSEIPFAPFLIIGTLLGLLFAPDIPGLHSLLGLL